MDSDEGFFATPTSATINQSAGLVPEESGKNMSKLPHPHTGRHGHIPNSPRMCMGQETIVEDPGKPQGLK